MPRISLIIALLAVLSACKQGWAPDQSAHLADLRNGLKRSLDVHRELTFLRANTTITSMGGRPIDVSTHAEATAIVAALEEGTIAEIHDSTLLVQQRPDFMRNYEGRSLTPLTRSRLQNDIAHWYFQKVAGHCICFDLPMLRLFQSRTVPGDYRTLITSDADNEDLGVVPIDSERIRVINTLLEEDTLALSWDLLAETQLIWRYDEE